MPFSMDMHKEIQDVTAEAVAGAHVKDIAMRPRWLFLTLSLGFLVGMATPVAAIDQSFLTPTAGGSDLTSIHGWYVDRHPRMLADVNGDGKKDLVGFGDAGVYVALSLGSKFSTAQFVVGDFGYNQGWRIDKHVRMMADINNDGKEDIVAFGDDGVWTALSTGTGFARPQFVLADFGYNQGWRIDKHVRLLVDVNGDGRKDIVAFGYDGVWLALANPAGGFDPAAFVIANFGINQGWDPAKHILTMADINNDGKDDIIAFGDDGVWTALSTGTGFAQPQFVLANFGYNQGWNVKRNPRMLVDVDHDGRKEIVGFGAAGVWVAKSAGDGGFDRAIFVSAQFGSDQWYDYPRFFADLNGDGYPDIVGLSYRSLGVGIPIMPAVSRALGGPSGFSSPRIVLINFVEPAGLLAVGDVDGDGKQDLVSIHYMRSWDSRPPEEMVARSSDSSPPPPPLPPSDVRVASAKPTSLTLTWKKGGGDDQYFSLTYTGNNQTGTLELAASPFLLTQLVPDTQYCFTVRAVTWFGISDATQQACGRTTPEPVTPWTDLYVHEVYLFPTAFPSPGDPITVSWSECADGTKTPGAYNVKVFQDGILIHSFRRSAGLSLGCHLSGELSTDVITTQAQAGEHDITVTVDTDNEVIEAFEDNNSTTFQYGNQ